MPHSTSRARFGLGVAAIFGSAALVRMPAGAAQFEYKCGHAVPATHPLHVRAVQMWAQVEKETGGRLKVDTYPNNQLGTSANQVSQCRLGAIHFVLSAESSLANLTPAPGILDVPFAFTSLKDVHAANDGPLGDYLRKQIEGVGLVTFPKIFDSGMRELTSSRGPIKSAADVAGLKIRVPTTKIVVDLWTTLGASPTALDLSETYTGLQTHLLEGTELPIATIEDLHIFEVQKYLSVTNHSWSGFYLITNPANWDALPKDVQDSVRRNVEKYAAIETQDEFDQSRSLVGKLQSQGMVVTTQLDMQSFRDKLSPFYARWKDAFGFTAWSLLERTSGKLG